MTSALHHQQQAGYSSLTRSPTTSTSTSSSSFRQHHLGSGGTSGSSGSLNNVLSNGNSSPRSVTSSMTTAAAASPMQSNVGVPQPTEEELNGRSFLEWLKAWDDNHVARWLADNRCATHASTFANNDVRGNVLLDVDQQALKEMGVQSVGDRMRIVVAIKKLRQACVAASSTAALASRRPLQSSLSGSAFASNGQGSAPSSPSTFSSGFSSGGAIVAQAQLARRVSNGKSAHRIPPPLHLSQSSVSDGRLPQAYQSTPVPNGHSSSGSTSSIGSNLTSAGSSNSITAIYGARSSSNNPALLAPTTGYTGPPPRGASATSSRPVAIAPPKTQPPPPPTSSSAVNVRPSTSQSRSHLAAPTISTTAASPTSAQGGSSSYGQVGELNTLRHKGSRPLLPGQQQYSHRKAGSTGGSISSMSSSSGAAHPYAAAGHQARPSTAQASYQQQHPYASATGSPTSNDGLVPSSSGRFDRPGTAPQEGRGYKTSNGSFGLSPIAETHSLAPSPVSAEHLAGHGSHPSTSSSTAGSSSTFKQQQQQQGYTVGKGGFARPTTAAGTVSITAGGGATPSGIIPFEEVMRKTVKFIGDDGISKMVNVDGARDAYEVMLRALRKFGKLSMNRFPDPHKDKNRNEYGETIAEMEGYGVFASKPDGSTRALTEIELQNICQSATRPERAKGLILRRFHLPAAPSPDESGRFTGKARKLRNFFGEDPNSRSALSPTSPTHLLDVSISGTIAEPASPTPSSPSSASENNDHLAPTPPQKPRQQRNTMNRASTVSIMSGLGWGAAIAGAGVAGSAAQIRSPSVGFIPSQTQKLRSFFGHRPPSELISSHLVDYFPNAASEKKILSKAVRNNVRKSMMRRESSYGTSIGYAGGKTSWESSRDSQIMAGYPLSRFSMSSAGSGHRDSIDTIPPLPVAKDGSSLVSRFSEDYDSASLGRPPLITQTSSASTPSISVHSDDEDDAATDAQSISSGMTRRMTRNRPSSRLSVWSHSKSNRDSDNASLLTVEEITEDLEKRRASRSSWLPEQAGELAGLADTSGDSVESDAAASSQLGVSEGSLTEGEDDIIEEEDEDVEDEEEDDADDDDDDDDEAETAADLDVPQTVTTTTKKSTFRWVKGALIGSGSFGQVYLGMNAVNGSFMAVKQVELPTGHSHNEERKKSMLSALEREIELLKEIQHENIVQYLDSHSDGKHLFIFLEYVPGGSVAHLLANYGAFEEALVRTFVRQILRGLAYLHENDIIHRDIKGANILVDNRGGIKISDFGISKKVEENLLTGSARLNRPSLQGSVFWMAPEVVKQTSYTAKADIWSLGCLIVEMFTGHHPWMELTQMQAIFKIGSAKDARPTIPSDFSPEGQTFLDLTFKMDYEERPTAAELAKQPFATEDFVPIDGKD